MTDTSGGGRLEIIRRLITRGADAAQSDEAAQAEDEVRTAIEKGIAELPEDMRWTLGDVDVDELVRDALAKLPTGREDEGSRQRR